MRRHHRRSAAARRARNLAAAMLAAASLPAGAGGLLLYEIGTADLGLAAAGYGARAQDASTVLTNPAGMTRLEGTQVLLAGQLLWGDVRFSIGPGTAPALGTGNGGYPVGWDGWFLGGGPFMTYKVSPDVTVGFAMTGNFGMPLTYDDNWAGRYYVQQATLIGLSFLPSIAWKVNDKLSVGATLNAMYGIYRNQVAINNLNPSFGDGKLRMEDEVWGWGVNLGLLYQFDAKTRVGLVWNSQVDLDFNAPLEWTNLAPGLSALLKSRGLQDASLGVGIKVPQGVMASVYSQVDDRLALLGSVGWQQWSKFGQVQIGIDNAYNPVSISKNLEFKDTWHVSAGLQYRLSDPWLVNAGIGYDSAFQSGNVSPMLPVNSAWRFGAGAQKQVDRGAFWGFALEYAYGGGLDVEQRAQLPVAAGGRGDLVGAYNQAGSWFGGAYYNWKF